MIKEPINNYLDSINMERVSLFSFVDTFPTDAFYPLTHLREIKDLVIGAFTQQKRVEQYAGNFNAKYIDKAEVMPNTPIYLFSSTYILSPEYFLTIMHTTKPTIWTSISGNYIALYSNNLHTDFQIESINLVDYETIIVEEKDIIAHFKNIADILSIQEYILQKDIQYILKHNISHSYPNMIVQGDITDILVMENVDIAPNVVFNTKSGSIFIDEGACIGAFSYIEGPCYIGAKAELKQAIVKVSYIGRECKIGGEVDTSIFLNYSNKAHTGYVGNSYIGSFVNFGALATTSNLKNNYKPITLEYLNIKIRTNSLKLGSIIGDFTALGIGVLLNTGTTIGIACNLIHQEGFLLNHIPSFTWKSIGDKYDWDKLIESIRYRMSRRNQSLEYEQAKRMKKLYDLS